MQSKANEVNDHPDYMVIKRLVTNELSDIQQIQPGEKLGIVVDTETTGLDWKTEKMFEIGMIPFHYDGQTGEILRVLDKVSEKEDPLRPLPALIQKITGYVDADLQGRKFNKPLINTWFGEADLIICHNSSFDRKFIEPEFPITETKAWACSQRQLDWAEYDIRSAKLDYIAFKLGFFFDHHQALEDCDALLAVLKCTLPNSPFTIFQMLLTEARKPSYLLNVLNSPFATKDKLKEKNYRWNPDKKCWHTAINNNDEMREATTFLATEIYNCDESEVRSRIDLKPIDAYNRFSIRES